MLVAQGGTATREAAMAAFAKSWRRQVGASFHPCALAGTEPAASRSVFGRSRVGHDAPSAGAL